MPISSADLQEVSKIALDEYMRNIPIEQIAVDRPLLKMLLKGRKAFLDAQQNIVENIRTNYSSNFSWAYGATPVAFNKRHTTEQAAYPCRRAVGGLYLDHDHRIKVHEDFIEWLDMELHRAGTHSTDAISGLDALISTTPSAGVIGGINAATATYWRNHAKTNIAPTDLAKEMEAAWRACIRCAGVPNFILAGADFIDAYRAQANLPFNPSIAGTDLSFKGVEILWSPQFEILQTMESALVDWNKRCYFINTKYLKLYLGDVMCTAYSTPFTPIKMRLALTCGQRNAHAVLAIA